MLNRNQSLVEYDTVGTKYIRNIVNYNVNLHCKLIMNYELHNTHLTVRL